MSSDDGWVLRRNDDSKFVLQTYSASDDLWPSIDDRHAQIFDTLQEALFWYESSAEVSEYGLSICIREVTRVVTPVDLSVWEPGEDSKADAMVKAELIAYRNSGTKLTGY